MLASMADELITEHIQFQTVQARSSVRDRLRHEGLDSKLGGVNRFATVADVIDHFQRERNASPLQTNEPHPTE
jgi:MFS superfamily sulfate permease-like transporter